MRRLEAFDGVGIAITLALLAVILGGCAAPGATESLKPVCAALVGPIHYTSHNPKSLRYAGPALAPDLAKRNRVGVNLHCPAYK